MSLILKKSVFYHIPRTGGVWVGKALRRAGLVEKEYSEENCPVGRLNLRMEHVSPMFADRAVVGHRPSFAFVRSPITWYQSFWKYKKANNGWEPPFLEYADDDFNGFVRKVLSIYPGLLTDMFKEFDGVTVVGRQEYLAEDLVKILKLFGEDFNEEYLVDMPIANESPPERSDSSFNCQYDPAVLKEMKEKEKWIFKKYYTEEI